MSPYLYDSLGIPSRFSITTRCLECGEPLSREAIKRRDDLCGECAA